MTSLEYTSTVSYLSIFFNTKDSLKVKREQQSRRSFVTKFVCFLGSVFYFSARRYSLRIVNVESITFKKNAACLEEQESTAKSNKGNYSFGVSERLRKARTILA